MCRSWPGISRIGPLLGVRCNNRNDNSNNNHKNDNDNYGENEDDGEGDVENIEMEVPSLSVTAGNNIREIINPSHLFHLDGLNIHDPAVAKSCCMAMRTRINSDGHGHMKFVFPVTVFSSQFDVQKLHEAVYRISCAMNR